jgi:hypothetical protein
MPREPRRNLVAQIQHARNATLKLILRRRRLILPFFDTIRVLLKNQGGD